MISTYLIYLTIAICVPLLIKIIVGNYKKITNRQCIWIYITLLIVSIIIGGRYEVGTDFPNYIDYYRSFLIGFYKLKDVFTISNNLEPGYLLINWIGAKLGLSISLFFTFIAYFSFLLLFKAQKDRAYLWPLILFFFYGQMFGISMNIIRQACAIFIFFYAIQFIGKSKVKLFLLITTCTMLHYSSVVLYLAMLIDLKCFKFIDNKKIIIVFYITTWFLASNILPLFMRMMPLDIFSAKYLNSLELADIEMEVSSGLGLLAAKITDILLIYQSDRVIEYYKDHKLRILYRLYFVGILMTNIMGVSVFLSRIFLGMVMLRIYVLAFTTHYCLKHKDLRRLLAIFLIMICILQLIMSIKNGASGISPYKFMWV